MNVDEVLGHISSLPVKSGGQVYISSLMPIVKKIKTDHDLAVKLWQTENIAAREVAVRIADRQCADDDLLEQWVRDLDRWDITDAFTGHLVRFTSYAVDKAHEWARREPEYQRRAGFATMAQMAWGRNDFDDHIFVDFLPLVEHYANDNRYYVKKAVNWALRDIGKRNAALQKHAQALALKLQASDHKTAQWVGRHRVKEFIKG